MLWRAVPQREPWFGRGSFWTPDVDFAARFAGWLDARFPGLSPHVLYRAKVKVTDGAHLKLPAFPFLESYRVMARVDVFSTLYQWVSFHEAPVEGRSPRQFVYLGTEPIRVI